MDYDVTLTVDGRDIPLNAFVQEVFRRVCAGLVDSLDRLPEERERVQILLSRRDRAD